MLIHSLFSLNKLEVGVNTFKCRLGTHQFEFLTELQVNAAAATRTHHYAGHLAAAEKLSYWPIEVLFPRGRITKSRTRMIYWTLSKARELGYEVAGRNGANPKW